ncbi:uncharacterized protein LY79DRAFT_149901 [Colletotrichum navitas]|uniref:Uncharacterized protein n=1 Tax=Colletotrichum navitas TaxID=681940 RepID=A0AAD8QBU1_9PEZI|nr:uncharacterized protein LY79DRAFT_149901 [Colletotrichum navitas]KAK1599730.1 hypothetical protein LY79DRAFT_149901 [Colletotrichum navitas]
MHHREPARPYHNVGDRSTDRKDRGSDSRSLQLLPPPFLACFRRDTTGWRRSGGRRGRRGREHARNLLEERVTREPKRDDTRLLRAMPKNRRITASSPRPAATGIDTRLVGHPTPERACTITLPHLAAGQWGRPRLSSYPQEIPLTLRQSLIHYASAR